MWRIVKSLALQTTLQCSAWHCIQLQRLAVLGTPLSFIVVKPLTITMTTEMITKQIWLTIVFQWFYRPLTNRAAFTRPYLTETLSSNVVQITSPGLLIGITKIPFVKFVST